MYDIKIYAIVDWVSIKCYLFVFTMIFTGFIGGILSILIRKTISAFFDPVSDEKNDEKYK